jgi:transcriptional regulator GlxA family with amidase domain
MKTAFIIFNHMTALDFVGVYDPLTRLKSMGFMPEFTWDICSLSADVRDDKGLGFAPTKIGHPLEAYDLVVVPGGFGTRTLVHDDSFMGWLRTAAGSRLKISVCTGSLLLGKAGFLRGKRATTHPSAYEELSQYCEVVEEARVVDEGEVVTARGVTAAIDLGLHIVGRLAGGEVRERIRQQMDYPYGAS